jgi:hypothetical protein
MRSDKIKNPMGARHGFVEVAYLREAAKRGNQFPPPRFNEPTVVSMIEHVGWFDVINKNKAAAGAAQISLCSNIGVVIDFSRAVTDEALAHELFRFHVLFLERV